MYSISLLSTVRIYVGRLVYVVIGIVDADPDRDYNFDADPDRIRIQPQKAFLRKYE
jgi:hypothetical protein